MFRYNLPPAHLAEWLGSFTCYCGNTEVEWTLNSTCSVNSCFASILFFSVSALVYIKKAQKSRRKMERKKSWSFFHLFTVPKCARNAFDKMQHQKVSNNQSNRVWSMVFYCITCSFIEHRLKWYHAHGSNTGHQTETSMFHMIPCIWFKYCQARCFIWCLSRDSNTAIQTCFMWYFALGSDTSRQTKVFHVITCTWF